MLKPQLKHENSGIHAQEDILCQSLFYQLTRNFLVYGLRVVACLYLCLYLLCLFSLRVQSDTLVDWIHTYNSVANQSACWICTELPLSMSASLPWHISPASVSNWTWLQKQCNSEHPFWNATWTDIYDGVKQWYDWPRF